MVARLHGQPAFHRTGVFLRLESEDDCGVFGDVVHTIWVAGVIESLCTSWLGHATPRRNLHNGEVFPCCHGRLSLALRRHLQY